MPKKKTKDAAKVESKLEIERVRENVKHSFIDDELIAFGYKLGQKYRSIRSVQSEKKAVAADYAAREKSLETDIDEISHKLNTGFEMRIKDCFKFMDFKAGRVYLFLCDDVGDPSAFNVPDSDALLEHLLLDEAFDPVLDRKLLDYERQAHLFPDPADAAAADDAEVDAEFKEGKPNGNETVETS